MAGRAARGSGHSLDGRAALGFARGTERGARVVKLAGSDLGELLGRLALGAEAAALIAGSASVREALARLEAGGMLMEAVRLLAHALPKREATWWACVCAGHTAPHGRSEAERAALAAAEQWVRRQSEELRRAALAAAQAAGFASPEGWAAVAAFWSGDPLAGGALAGAPAAAQPLTGVAVVGALALASVRLQAERQRGRLARFLESGHNIAAGGPGRLAPEEG
jgi:hypothetical protein